LKLTKKFKALFLTALLTAAVSGTTLTHADQIPFIIKPTFPSNQIGNAGYYDLLMAPGQTQTIEVNLTNTSDKAITVECNIAQATTGNTGVVNYNKISAKADPSLKYHIEDYSSIAPEVEIQPQTSVKVPVKLTMPNEKFDGVIATGLSFEQKESQAKPTTTTVKNVQAKNYFYYSIALLMQQNTTKVAPNLNLTKVTASQVNAHNNIIATYENTAMTYIQDVSILSQVTKKNDIKILYSNVQEQMKIAPNSNFAYPLALNGKAYEAGTYSYSATIYGNPNPNGKYAYGMNRYDNQWLVHKDFTITKQEAATLNKKDVTLPKTNPLIYWIIGIIIALILAVIALFILVWKKKNKKVK
jgi:hypothetical protein